MPRKPRENLEDGIYHVYARGNAQELIYRDAADRRIYLKGLGKVVTRKSWRCLAYCLMNNHVHLLLETPHADLSSGMQALHGRYGQIFNVKYGRTGHVFQGRYGAVRISSDAQLCATAAYIARNPAEAGMCAHPEDWEWSSYRQMLSRAGPEWLASDRLLSWFDEDSGRAMERYIQMSQLPAAF